MRPALAFAIVLTGLFGSGQVAAQGVRPSEAPERGTRLPGRGSEEDRLGHPEPRTVQIPWDQDKPVPPGFRLGSGPRWGLFVGGMATFGFSYLTGVILAANDVRLTGQDEELEVSSGRNDPLYAPLIGPFVALGTEERPAGEQALLAVGGLLQAGGLTLAMFGLAGREVWLERDVALGLAPGGASLRLSF
jgi:hypothetical protein